MSLVTRSCSEATPAGTHRRDVRSPRPQGARTSGMRSPRRTEAVRTRGRASSETLGLQPPGCTGQGDLAETFSNRPIAARAALAAPSLNLRLRRVGRGAAAGTEQGPVVGLGWGRRGPLACSEPTAARPRAGNSVAAVRGAPPWLGPAPPWSWRSAGAGPRGCVASVSVLLRFTLLGVPGVQEPGGLGSDPSSPPAPPPRRDSESGDSETGHGKRRQQRRASSPPGGRSGGGGSPEGWYVPVTAALLFREPGEGVGAFHPPESAYLCIPGSSRAPHPWNSRFARLCLLRR